MRTIHLLLLEAIPQLAKVSDTARLDAELLLAEIMDVTRTYLHACPDQELRPGQISAFWRLAARRMNHEPVAYIIGHKEFWSLDLKVTKDTLIPRPETELLVDLVLAKLPHFEAQYVADLGTGSGAIALALASECPQWLIHATDIMPAALEVAQENAARLEIGNVMFYQGSWCDALPITGYHAIVSNPPYIAPNDEHLSGQELSHEPATALISADNGLKDIKLIIKQARDYLIPGGWLLLEHGYNQGLTVTQLLNKAGYIGISDHHDLAGQRRIAMARTQPN